MNFNVQFGAIKKKKKSRVGSQHTLAHEYILKWD